jgi:hypothetical protein
VKVEHVVQILAGHMRRCSITGCQHYSRRQDWSDTRHMRGAMCACCAENGFIDMLEWGPLEYDCRKEAKLGH